VATGRPAYPGRRSAVLKDAALEKFARTAARLILAARPNKWFPDPFACADRLRFLAPSLRRGVYGGIHLDLASGLPAHRDILCVQVDRDLAPEFIRQAEARLSAGRELSPRVSAKLAYYRDLARVELPPLTRIDVNLRRVFPERNTAAFQVVFDRFDISEGVFVRYTLLLEQSDAVYGSRLLERSGDYSLQTSAFRETMEKLAKDESEIMFLLLGKREGVRLEEVTRGRIGPLWSPWAAAPQGWLPSGASEAFVLHCPLDRASVAFEKDIDQDPFTGFFKDFLSKESRPLVEETASQLGYRVHKERKFACTKAAEGHLRSRLREAGTRNMVYTA